MCFNLDSRFTETPNVRITGWASVEIMRTTQDHPLNSDSCVIHDDGRTLHGMLLASSENFYVPSKLCWLVENYSAKTGSRRKDEKKLIAKTH